MTTFVRYLAPKPTSSPTTRRLPGSEETLTPQIKQACQEAKMTKNPLASVEARVWDLRGAYKELQGSLRRIAGVEVETRLQEILPQEKVTKRVIFYDKISATDASESYNNKQGSRRRHHCQKKTRALTDTGLCVWARGSMWS